MPLRRPSRRKAADAMPDLIAEVGPYVVLDHVPDAVLVMDERGQIVFRNKAALALSDQVIRARGQEILLALRTKVGEIARTERTFPCTKVVAVENDGHHAEAEMIVERLPRGFTAVWRDITMVRDTARSTEAVAHDLGEASAGLL